MPTRAEIIIDNSATAVEGAAFATYYRDDYDDSDENDDDKARVNGKEDDAVTVAADNCVGKKDKSALKRFSIVTSPYGSVIAPSRAQNQGAGKAPRLGLLYLLGSIVPCL